jgi:hypothetical protein
LYSGASLTPPGAGSHSISETNAARNRLNRSSIGRPMR